MWIYLFAFNLYPICVQFISSVFANSKKYYQKKRKVQLAAIWSSKALKAKNTANEIWSKIISSDDDNELSDCHNSDDDWHDDEFENNLNQISQTVFDIMIENAKEPIAFTNNRPLVYIGNSERTQRRKKSAAKIATAGIPI